MRKYLIVFALCLLAGIGYIWHNHKSEIVAEIVNETVDSLKEIDQVNNYVELGDSGVLVSRDVDSLGIVTNTYNVNDTTIIYTHYPDSID